MIFNKKGLNKGKGEKYKVNKNKKA